LCIDGLWVWVWMCGDVEARERIDWVGLSYLAGRDKLQRAQRTLQVGDIVLEVSQRLRNVSNGIWAGRSSRNLRWRCWSQSRKGSASKGCWARSCSASWTCWRLMSSLSKGVGLSSRKVRTGRILGIWHLVDGGWSVHSFKRSASSHRGFVGARGMNQQHQHPRHQPACIGHVINQVQCVKSTC
jgi:hypothetical protein